MLGSLLDKMPVHIERAFFRIHEGSELGVIFYELDRRV
jgi:hypothetical protein